MTPHFYARYAVVIVAVVGLLFPITLGGAILALQSNRNDVQDWLPETFQETRQYHEFQRYFKNETFVLVSWEGCTLDDPRLGRFAKGFSAQASEPAEESYFSKVITGQSLIEQLTRAPTSLSYEKAVERLKRSMVGRDGRTTCAVLIVSAHGKEHLHPALEQIYRVGEQCGVARPDMRMGGPPVDNVAIDLEGERMLITLFGLSAVVGIALAWWYLRALRLTVMVVIGGVYSAALSLAIVRFTGSTMNSILLTMPAVVYTSGLATAIHIINYYRHARTLEGVETSPMRGVKLAWLPCLLSGGTTSLGLVSLYTSELVPIKHFGLYASIGVMAAVGLMFVFLPSALYLWPPAMAGAREGGIDESISHAAADGRRLRRAGQLVIARPWAIWTMFLVLMVVCGSGLVKAKTTVDLMSLFAPDAQVIHHYRWLEEKLGPLVPMEVVLRIREDAELSFLERFELVQKIQRKLETIPEVGSTMSPATFAPELTPPRRRGLARALMRGSTFRMVMDRRLRENREEFVGDYLVVDPERGEELWRINVRVAALQQVDYGEFIHHIRQYVDPMVRDAPGITSVVYTGLAPVVFKAERELLDGLVESFILAFVTIAAMMALVFRNVLAGFYTMLPNVWPVAVVFGAMSWLGIKLDIGTMMTASVAMGVCVDDTVHFATWFRRSLRLGLSRRDAVVMAYEKSAAAIYQSTIIVALGLVTFGVSSFMPTRRFGFLMFTLLGFGLFADLVLTPAMFAGPIGRYFARGIKVPRRRELKRRYTTARA